jgi:hypothetical protein
MSESIARNRNDMSKKPACRIYVIKSPASPVAAVFRRGPSKQVQILKWDMKTDVFTPGQSFKGRIYERRCDVSPSGQYLIYFAAKHKPPLYSWTAVSKLPYLTALALWPTRGPSGGGGLFETEQCIQLNLSWFAMVVAEGFELPDSLKISQLGEGPGSGEDEPIHRSRMQRDGWQVKQEAVANYSGLSKSELIDQMQDFLAIAQKLLEDMSIELPARRPKTTPYADTGPMFAVYDPPEILEKQSGTSVLEMTTLGYGEENGQTYVIKYRVLDQDKQCLLDLGRPDWADWSDEGDLLFAKDGGIYRLGKSEWNVEKAVLLTDLNDAHFEAVEAPDEYKCW